MIEKSILKTLAHYEAERGIPLSAFEIHKYLHKSDAYIEFEKVFSALEALVSESKISSYNGFYFLPENSNNKYINRIEKDKASIKKWKDAKRMVWLMQVIPFVRSISVAGSLSMNNVSEKSDIDIFIISKPGRIWTTRTLSMMLTQILFKRRHDEKIDNKICLNYYIKEGKTPEVKNIASANVFLRTIPIYNSDVYVEFFKKNADWFSKYFQNQSPAISQKREVKESAFLQALKTFFEFLLSGWFGDKVENIFAGWQRKRIEKKIKDEKNVTNLIYTDDILMFHWPHPRNEEVLRKYETLIKEI